MRKIILAVSTLLAFATLSTGQELYNLNNSWINLEDFSKKDAIENPDSDFKLKGKYCNRFAVINLLGQVTDTANYKDRPFHLIDDNTLAYKVQRNGRDINVQINKEEEPMDEVPGKKFLVSALDGVVLVQRFEGNLGYRVTCYDEWAKVRYKQVIPHTRVVEKDGEEFKQPYLTYFTHTPRFMVFNSLDSRDISKTVIMDLKDGKMTAWDLKVCGVIRMDNELSLNGYIIRDEKAKTLTVKQQGATWAIKDDNCSKVIAETLVSDSLLIVARYYKGIPDISLTAYGAKSGKVVWNGEVVKPEGAPQRVILSKYNNKILLEGLVPDNNFLQVVDVANGKKLYSSL